MFAQAFHPSCIPLQPIGCLVVCDFNLDQIDPPSCGGGFNIGEWANSSTHRDITDGDPTCLPHSNAALQSTGRAIDLALLDPGAFDSRRWGRLELLTIDHHHILITLGGPRIPRTVRTRVARFVYETAAWDAFAESVRSGVKSLVPEFPTR